MLSQLLKQHIARGLVIVSLFTGTLSASLIHDERLAEAALAETSASVNFRYGPSTNYSVIRTLAAGTTVDVTSHGTSWSRVRHSGTSGYLATRYINFTSTGVITGQVNLRDRAGTSSNILVKIPAGQTVQVLAGPASGWYKVVWGSLTGFVYGSYVDVSEGTAVVSVPAAEEVEAPQAAPAIGQVTEHILKTSTPIYMNAADAGKRINSVGAYAAGTYYLFKSYSGMLNISKTQGQAGAWINPEAFTIPTTGTTTTDPYAGYTKMTWTVSFYTSLAIDNGGYTTTALGTRLRYGVLASNYWPLRSLVSLPGWGEFTIEDRGGSDFDSKYRLDMLIPRNTGETDYQYRSRIWAMGRKSITGYIKPNN